MPGIEESITRHPPFYGAFFFVEHLLPTAAATKIQTIFIWE